ncbi:MAG TPA: hypothetical protein VMZ30_17660 [Pyrinomonadaceae bacterium]|nr:hypothetical protein [Pyrinomonadaceae bacterium]
MDMGGQLKQARSKMLGAQGALDDYLRSGQSDKTEFDFLFDISQQAHACYATTLREYMDEKYPRLEQQAASIGPSEPTKT